jgi:peptide/nickel transport system permease protein
MTAVLARGLSHRQMLWRHAWRLSAKPVVAVAGPMAGTLLSGSFAVELVTSWPGLARLTYDALVSRDIYLAAGCATAAAVFLAAGVFASDVLLAAVDPRITSPSTTALETVRS